MNRQHLAWLRQLTQIPTAAGREDRVVRWIARWAARRPRLRLTADRFGNLEIKIASRRRPAAPPLYFTAHLDHPAFVVSAILNPRAIEAEFRGGVEDRFFLNAPVRLHPAQGPSVTGVIAALTPPADDRLDKRVTVRLRRPTQVAVNDVMTWDIPPSRIADDRLHAPACDDLAGVAACLAAIDTLSRDPQQHADVRVLLTRAEEIGFIGAIAACSEKLLPAGARMILMENSRSFPDSPIGAGPIVRVGDRLSTFDPDLTYRLGQLANQLAQHDPAFLWQRKLMPGGSCEASAYQALGYTAACLCLPLGNYHNMNQTTQQIDHEIIHVHDYLMLVRWLQAITRQLDDPQQTPTFAKRLSQLLASRRYLLEG